MAGGNLSNAILSIPSSSPFSGLPALSRARHSSRRKPPSIRGPNPATNSVAVGRLLSLSGLSPVSFRQNVRPKCLHRVVF